MLVKSIIDQDCDYFLSKASGFSRNGQFEAALRTIELVAHTYYHTSHLYDSLDINRTLSNTLDTLNLVAVDEALDAQYILFVDYYGLDNRGLTEQYLRGILDSGLKLVYLHLNWERGFLTSNIYTRLIEANAEILGVPKHNSLLKKLAMVTNFLRQYKPQNVFFHTSPWDTISPAIAAILPAAVKFQINITDHAYWIGSQYYDFILNFRKLGAAISVCHRGVSREKQLLIPMYPIIPEARYKDESLADDIKDKIVIFSGGNTYKVSVEGNSYFDVLATILKKYNNVLFIYIGGGDHKPIKKFISNNNFEKKVIYLGERDDFFDIMKLSDIYFGTYPIGGGLMSLYAASAALPFLSLVQGTKHKIKFYELMKRKPKFECLFESKDECIAEFERLITETAYRKRRAIDFTKVAINEKEFNRKIRLLLGMDFMESTILIDEAESPDTELFSVKQRYHEKKFIQKYYLIPLKHLGLRLLLIDRTRFFKAGYHLVARLLSRLK